jgi:predicted RNA-binding Zn ribbon-like protein
MSRATVWTDDHFIAGDVALDFANTVYRRTPELGADLLNTPEALFTWLARQDLLPATDRPGSVFAGDAAALHEARELRALFWKVFDAQKNSQTIPTGAVTGLLDTARRRNASIAVYPDGSMTSLTAWGAFPLLALRAINLTLNPPRHGVRACDRCGWFFIDASRSRRRRWCSMKTCGNQAKAERYRSAHP